MDNSLSLCSLSRLQSELSLTSQKEREMSATLRDSEDVLAKRRAEIARMRDQVSSTYCALFLKVLYSGPATVTMKLHL